MVFPLKIEPEMPPKKPPAYPALRRVSRKQRQELRKWAHDNYEPFTDIPGRWHPIVQKECVKMNMRAVSALKKVVKMAASEITDEMFERGASRMSVITLGHQM